MIKLNQLILSVTLVVFSMSQLFGQTNAALSATATTSYVSPWETLDAVNDGFTPSNSNDKSQGAYGNWNNPNSIQWVQYDWNEDQSINSVEVYWFDDNGGVLTPTTAYVEHWNGSSWIHLADVPLQKDAFNTANFSVLSTSRIRLSMLNPSQSTGILEWRAWTEAPGGNETNLALTATASTSYVSSWETLTAVNDDSNPSNSNDKSSGAYGNWNNPNSIQWVQYDWSSSVTVTSTEVYWFDDNGGVLTPTTAYVEYWNGSSWVNVGNVPTTKDAWNTLSIAQVSTTRVRISMLNPSQSTGILEWRVLGTAGGGGCNPTALTPYYQLNGGSWVSDTQIAASQGDEIQFGPHPSSGGSWSWTGPAGYSSGVREAIVSNVQVGQAGTYTSTHTNSCGAQSTLNFNVTVTGGGGGQGDPYTWPSYSPNISYNFADEFPSLPTPTQILNDCPQVVGTQSDDWWAFRWGPNANSLVTSNAITPMLERMNTDFEYFRDEMGWPPDLRAKNGYRSCIYLYGSGLCTDNASNTDLGGWQSAIYYNGQSWPMVLASYYPVYSFDPACTYSDKVAQQGAMVHEGIHSVLADLPGVKQSAWFHEGGNVWLQQTADARRTGDFSSMGSLNGTDFIAPFMPIECYSGWLQDGSFGGPSAEGVNMFENGQQICTWRTYLGGHQYSSSFPTFLGNTLGDGAVPWIWRYSPDRVLEGIADGIGGTQTRRLISEYRAKQALVDFGPWNSAIIALLDANFQLNVQAEWQPSWLNPAPWSATPYVSTTNNGGTLTPESRTTPGWSGGNQIPLHVAGNMVTVNFQPIGANMTCQLAYRATDGTPIYSEIVSSGNVSLRLDQAPANGVVIAIVANTDYIYEGESTRTAHFDYRIQLVEGVTGAADIYTKWYYFQNLGAGARKLASEAKVGADMSKYCSHSYHYTPHVAEVTNAIQPNFVMYPNPTDRGSELRLAFTNQHDLATSVSIVNSLGQVVFSDLVYGTELRIDPSQMPDKGLYVVTIKNSEIEQKQKLIVD